MIGHVMYYNVRLSWWKMTILGNKIGLATHVLDLIHGTYKRLYYYYAFDLWYSHVKDWAKL